MAEEQPESKRQKVDEGQKPDNRQAAVAPIRPEYIISREDSKVDPNEQFDDEAEGRGPPPEDNKNKKNKKRGQNKARKLFQGKGAILLCDNIRMSGDVSQCKFGDSCRREHNIDTYLAAKPADIEGVCPVFEAIGYCPAGLKCRWLGSHFDAENKRPIEKETKDETVYEKNRIATEKMHELQRKQYTLPKSDQMLEYFEKIKGDDAADSAAAYVEPPFQPLEKKKLYYNRAKILSPLTTVGNLPFRRLMKEHGADVTFSEMAMGLPLLQGQKSEWALPRSHANEKGGFGVQIAGSKPWQTTKAAEALTNMCPDIDELNLNCGCPIDLLYRVGAGSAMMDNPGKMMKILKGMNYVSKDVPVTVKIRTGVKENHPTAKSLVTRLMKEGQVAAITIHGRSRAQRYTRLANWDYIKEVADLVKSEREQNDDHVKPWIIGNGDVYSWEDWYEHVEKQGVDSVMVARGALIKPWIFEEIEAKQYLDKSASERLEMVRKFAHYGLDHWGSDEYGVNLTRRFLCEWLSFTHRYIPEGILEYLPPRLHDRPPPFQGRNELETLLSSSDYKDWIKITEMFLGPASESFEFVPKHKSSAY